jgi:hypothetical protein
MNRSENIATLAAALCAAQAEMRGAAKDASNPIFRSKYATLASVWDAAREPLTSNGLSVVQVPEASEPGTCTLTTVLLHTSGEWLSSTMSVPVLPQVVVKGQDPAQTPQGYGSALTYARRYALAAMVGIAPDDDDDGNGASSKAPGPAPKKAPQAPPRAEKPPLNRPAAIRKIEELGGDVEHAKTLSDDALVAYGKALKSLPEPPEEPQARTNKQEEGVTVTGFLTGTPYVSEKVCKFSLFDDGGEHPPIAVFPQRSCWHQVVSGDGKFAVEPDEAVKVTGKVKFDEKYGESIIADTIEFLIME